MKPLLIPLICLISATFTLTFASDEDPYRTFTDQEGRTLRAVIVRTGPEHVWIRRDDGRTFQVEQSIFSETDRQFISNWERDQALEADDAIEFAVKRYFDGQSSHTTKSRRIRDTRYGYTVTVENNTTIDLNNLEVEYRYYVLRGQRWVSGQDRPLERHTGRTRIQSLSSRDSQEFQTPSVELTSVHLRSGWTSSSIKGRRREDSLGGIWVRIKEGNELIAEFSSPSSLKEDENW